MHVSDEIERYQRLWLAGKSPSLIGDTLPETNSSNLKMDGWNTTFILGCRIFRCELLVSGTVQLQTVGFFYCHVSFKRCTFQSHLAQLGGTILEVTCFSQGRSTQKSEFKRVTGIIKSDRIKLGSNVDMGVSLNGGTPKTHQNDHF